MTSPATCVFCDRALHASLGDKRLLFAIRDEDPARHPHSLVGRKRRVRDTIVTRTRNVERLDL